MPQRPNWDNIRIFLAIARTRQFVAAGRALGLDHATVARRAAALEEELGTQLLVRSTTGTTLTPAGEQFLTTAETIESHWLEGVSGISDAGRAISGTVRIGVPDGFGSLFLAQRLGPFIHAHPALVVQLVPLQRTLSLSKREADLAVVIDPPSDTRLTTRKLADYSLSFYAAPDYLAACGAPRTAGDLLRHVLVTSVPDLHYSESQTYHADVFISGQHRLECGSVNAQIEAVRAGAGIGILHDYAARTDRGLVPLLPDLRFRRAYHLIAHKDTRRLARIDKVHRHIVSLVEEAATIFG